MRDGNGVDPELKIATRRVRRRSLVIVLALGVVLGAIKITYPYLQTVGCAAPSGAPLGPPAASATSGATVAASTSTTAPGHVPFGDFPTGPDGTPLTALPSSAFSTTSELPRSTGRPASTADVTVLKPSQSSEEALAAAFATYEELPKTCKAATVAGTVYLAEVKATGASWGVAGFKPAPGCYGGNANGSRSCGSQIPPFDVVPLPPVGVFEKQPGGHWVENNQAGKPFPCPPAGDAVPGPSDPYVPVEVLHAWKIPYATPNCLEIYPRPHG